jgi:uncharacterized membrane protein YoaK (UPF0700 family)
MSRDDLWHLALAICLTGIAGYVDATGLLYLGDLFVSFMSGNSTQLGVAASRGDWHQAGTIAAIIVLFVAGVAIGRVLAKRAKTWRVPAILTFDAVLLGLAVLLAPSRIAVAAMVLAMGAQNEALQNAGVVKTSLTYVTGTLVNLGERLADMFDAPDKRWAWLPYLLLWGGLMVGAIVGAYVYRRLALHALIWPALVVASLALVTAVTTAREYFKQKAA